MVSLNRVPILSDTQLSRVGLCIRGLLHRGRSKGPYLEEFPCHQKEKSKIFFEVLSRLVKSK